MNNSQHQHSQRQLPLWQSLSLCSMSSDDYRSFEPRMNAFIVEDGPGI